MKPRSNLGSFARWASVVAASLGIFAVGTVISSSVVVEQISAVPVKKAEIKRPSYLSELPELTARSIDAGNIVAAAVDVAPATTDSAAAAPTLEVSAAPATAVSVAPEAKTPAADPLDTYFVTANGLNVRSGPSGSSSKLFVLLQGEEVQVAETDGNWARVTSASGETGWAYTKYLAPGN